MAWIIRHKPLLTSKNNDIPKRRTIWQTIWRTGYSQIEDYSSLRRYQYNQRSNYQFFIEIIEQEKQISSLTASFEERPDNMSASNRLGINIEASKSEIEAAIELKLDDIKADHMKEIN